MSSEAKREVSIKNGDKWSAWVNTMPGSSHTLHVAGTVETGSLATELVLEPAGLEKSNPPGLILKLVSQQIFIPRPAGDTVVEVKYSEPADVGKYSAIYIEYPDGRVTIDTISIAT